MLTTHTTSNVQSKSPSRNNGNKRQVSRRHARHNNEGEDEDEDEDEDGHDNRDNIQGISTTTKVICGLILAGVLVTVLVLAFAKSKPGAPTNVIAVAGSKSATVSFTAPSNNGNATITSYTVTSSPGNVTASGSSSPITVNGLTNNTAYTFTATATNSSGTSVASSASASVTPLAPRESMFLSTVQVAVGTRNFDATWGNVIRFTTAGRIVGLRMYITQPNLDNKITLWGPNDSTGTNNIVLGSGTINQNTNGWANIALDAPVTIRQGLNYIVCYSTVASSNYACCLVGRATDALHFQDNTSTYIVSVDARYVRSVNANPYVSGYLSSYDNYYADVVFEPALTA